MVLPVPTDMFLSNIDPVYPARAGSAASQNSPPSNAPTNALIALDNGGRCFVPHSLTQGGPDHRGGRIGRARRWPWSTRYRPAL
jgi:hypothetical protein